MMRRGQAFEVFRLLIAAVIAGAILMVLLNILGGVGIRTQDPQDFVNQAVQSLANNGGIRTSAAITFEKGQAILLSAAATSATLDSSCVTCDNADIKVKGFTCSKSKDGDILSYTGAHKVRAKIQVKCAPQNDATCPVKCTVSIIKP